MPEGIDTGGRDVRIASDRSTTACARAAMDRPVIAIRSGVSWSIVSETRSSRARFAAFWLSRPQRKYKVRPSFT